MLCIGRFGSIGSYNHTIDSKNRLFLPAKQRDYLGSTVILTRGLRNCLYMYTAEGWENFISKIDNDNDTTLENMFIRGNSLFHDSTFQKIARMREMDADFGIIPYPMASESQDSYYTRVSGALFSNVPVTQENKENIGLILEKLAEESAKVTTPAYKNVIMKGKYSRDNKSSQMLDLLYDTRVYDLGDSFWCDIIRDNFIKTMMTTNDRNLSSNVKKFEKVIDKKIDKVITNITANAAE